MRELASDFLIKVIPDNYLYISKRFYALRQVKNKLCLFLFKLNYMYLLILLFGKYDKQ